MLVKAFAMLRTKREQLPAAQARQLAALIAHDGHASAVGARRRDRRRDRGRAGRTRAAAAPVGNPEHLSMWVEASRRSAQRATCSGAPGASPAGSGAAPAPSAASAGTFPRLLYAACCSGLSPFHAASNCVRVLA